tara:strand:- start:63272 stop:63463 length:192 start_codon:yes stop_codon:yes gene_type:complete
MNCTECNQPIGCGCNKATGGDGAVVHKGCLSKYNGRLTGNVTSSIKNNTNNLGEIVIPPTTAR